MEQLPVPGIPLESKTLSDLMEKQKNEVYTPFSELLQKIRLIVGNRNADSDESVKEIRDLVRNLQTVQ